MLGHGMPCPYGMPCPFKGDIRIMEKHRRSIRLSGYDYSQAGLYYSTICVKNRVNLFGHIAGGEMVLNEYGKIVGKCWQGIPDHFHDVLIDEFVVMPNHTHGILLIRNESFVGARHAVPLPDATIRKFGKPIARSLPTIIRSFKSAVTRQINEYRLTPGATVWQRNYYEHIIRNQEELDRIRKYIVDNPKKWAMDRENPDACLWCAE